MARRVVAMSVIVGILDWVLLVARDQYGILWLQPYDIVLDALFVGAVVSGFLAYRARTHGTRHVMLRAIIVLVVTVMSLGFMEVALRFAFRNARSSANVGDVIGRKAASRPIRLNSLGFRDHEVSPKTPGHYRILVIGDSITWGQGLEESERFTNLIQEFLGPRYDVVNFGLSGTNLPEHLDLMDQALKQAPDYILLQLFINDFETAGMERPHPIPLVPPPLDRVLLQSSLVFQLLQSQSLRLQSALGIRESYVAFMIRNLRDPNAANAQEAFGYLGKIFRRARAANVEMGVVMFPATDVMGTYGADYPFTFIHDRVRDICSGEQVSYVDLFAAFAQVKHGRSLWVSPFDPHPNADGNKRAAFQIVTLLSPIWQKHFGG